MTKQKEEFIRFERSNRNSLRFSKRVSKLFAIGSLISITFVIIASILGEKY